MIGPVNVRIHSPFLKALSAKTPRPKQQFLIMRDILNRDIQRMYYFFAGAAFAAGAATAFPGVAAAAGVAHPAAVPAAAAFFAASAASFSFFATSIFASSPENFF